ncbi:DDE-type integrase/transposase/recombinase [Methylobacterium sp. CB376]|uniref:DDE-type integrase/transposase/recombinase n=1 Tax=Methylobacterium sp. (strain 4-46) TaxID=426117 RepID=UPI000152E5D9|nr:MULTISPECIES: DDE-type integrase/transposase/recombinase [Methylobacterium]WFT82046.1 DDE-type integrase/transposase/recombinase [Methylobacterium nodulans]
MPVKDDETAASAVAFLEEALAALPFRVTHLLTDRGSCFTADDFEAACRQHTIAHRTTRPYTPRTNGMVERFNGRVQREVLGITLYSHQDLETVLAGFNLAYNGRRQRVLKGRSPDRVLRERLKAKPELAKPVTRPPDPDALPAALKVVAGAKEVSHPDTVWIAEDGATMTEIATYLGHSDDAITQRVYAKLSPNHLRRASRALEVGRLRVQQPTMGSHEPESGS